MQVVQPIWGRQLCCASSLAIICALASSVAGQAHAQSASTGSTLEEVVVTARKREESLQSIPVAVSAISGENLAREGIREPADLARIVPSLNIQGTTGSTGTGMILSIRGQQASDVLLTLSTPVGLYEDSVNIPHPVGSNIAFFDLQRVEVLKGPQGTLYGRNTTGGAINIITRGADYNGIHGFAYGEAGNFKDWKLAGAVNIPIVPDMLAARLSYQHWKREGFGRSAVTGQRVGDDRKDDLARLSVRFDPISTVSVIGKLEYFRAHRTDQLYHTRVFRPGVTPTADAEWVAEGRPGGVAPSILVNQPDLFTDYSNTNNFEHLSGWHGVVDGSWDITDAVRLRSITGYHQFKDFRVFDLDGMPIQAFEVGFGPGATVPVAGTETRPLKPDQASRQWTQEFNLSGNAFSQHLKWLVGYFYNTDKGNQNQTASVFPAALAAAGPLGPFNANFHSFYVKNSSWALFTQNDFKFNDVFSITAGARYTEERLSQNIAFSLHLLGPNLFFCQGGANKNKAVPTEEACAVQQQAKFSGTSYLLSFNFQLTPDMLLYVKTARGFRGGALQVRAPDSPPASPEIATDYEVGLKSDLLDRRLRANLAVFQTNYANKQETAIVTLPTGAQATPIVNAASARIRGVEGEFTAVPMHNLTLTASFGYLDGQYQNYPAALTSYSAVVNGSGAAFATPRWTYNIGGRYVMPSVGPGDIGISANYAWRGRIPTTIINNDPAIPANLQDKWRRPIGLLNASLDYKLVDRGLTFTIFATNLTNKRYELQGLTFLTYGYTAVTQEPRMWGVSVRKTFGND